MRRARAHTLQHGLAIDEFDALDALALLAILREARHTVDTRDRHHGGPLGLLRLKRGS